MSDDIEQVKRPEGYIISDAESRSLNITSSHAAEEAATKKFVINATGNLFIATTLNGADSSGADISPEAEVAFGQVSVFFSAMTKAMAAEELSLFDYKALNRIVSSSGLFVKVTQSDIFFESSSWGVKFGNQLIQTLFGLSGNLAAIGKSLMDMVVGIGKEAKEGIKVSGDKSKKKTDVGTIIFVCEYLLGAVSITPIVIRVDAEEAAGVYNIGPCFKAHGKTFNIAIEKSVYLFVAPQFIQEAAALNEAMEDPEFNNLVESIRASINKPAENEAS